MNFDHDYIQPGDCFADETVLCMKCEATISRLGYKEMPKINDAKKTVNVAAKMPTHLYTQVPMILLRDGKESVVHALTCKACRHFDLTEETGTKIIAQIKRAMQIQAHWAGYPDEAIQAIEKQYANVKLVRKLSAEELVDLYSRQGVM